MSRFTGSLRVPGQAASVVRVVLSLEEERLVIRAGDRDIGAWSLSDTEVTLDDDGVRLRMDDEELFVVVADRDRFARTLQSTLASRRPTRRRLFGRRRKDPHPVQPGRGEPPPREEPRREEPPPREEPRREEPPPREEPRREEPPPREREAPRPWLGPALGVAVLVGLALLAPGVLVAILMTAGGLLVLAGMAAAGDDYLATRLPDVLSIPRLLGWGTAAILVALLVAVLT